MHINLLVLRTQHLERLRTFYETLFEQPFAYHTDHGAPHYSTRLGTVTLELYPTEQNIQPTDMPGLVVNNIEDLIKRLSTATHTIQLTPNQTTRKKAAIIKDPDGRKIYLTES